ncbi:Uncharacterised protein [Suttonella ornithocola]|uniref:Uncharacterized protein n=1 Tax=Suttonella ornithocola TaxID=279832 RepID=A0A380MMV9_9GAMM|nr:Uncharacterised protein [Suttonella ornithocola]
MFLLLLLFIWNLISFLKKTTKIKKDYKEKNIKIKIGNTTIFRKIYKNWYFLVLCLTILLAYSLNAPDTLYNDNHLLLLAFLSAIIFTDNIFIQ